MKYSYFLLLLLVLLPPLAHAMEPAEVIVVAKIDSDIIAPVVNTFVVPARAISFQIDMEGFSTTDNVGETGYLITESPQTPAIDALAWRFLTPKQWLLTGGGRFRLYASVEDVEGSISSPASTPVEIVLSEHVTVAVMPSGAMSLHRKGTLRKRSIMSGLNVIQG